MIQRAAFRIFFIFFFLSFSFLPSSASEDKEEYFADAAAALDVPLEWTKAIAEVESGYDAFTMNVEGQGYRFATKKEALAAAHQAQKAGMSFDSGIMQINNWWLDKYGISLEAAFDPEANVYLGSWILQQEIKRHGRTWLAVARYHSPNPDRGRRYVDKVKTALRKKQKTLTAQPSSAPKGKKKGKKTISSATTAPLIVYRRTVND